MDAPVFQETFNQRRILKDKANVGSRTAAPQGVEFKQIYQWAFYRFLEATFMVFLGLLKNFPPHIFRRGRENLVAALAKGRGVIALGAHSEDEKLSHRHGPATAKNETA